MQKENFLSADQKTKIGLTVWRPEKEPTAVVQLVHGMAEFSERYAGFADFLTSKGIVVAAHDHLGHGESIRIPEDYGHFSNEKGINLLLEDISFVNQRFQEEYSHLPYFILGHSMGSFLLKSYLGKYPTSLDGAILMGSGWHAALEMRAAEMLSSVIGLLYGKKHRSQFIDNLAFGGYNKKFEPADTTKDWLTRDKTEVAKYLQDKRTQFIFTTAAYNDLFKAIRMGSEKKQLRNIQEGLPLLVISGTADPVGNQAKGVRKLAKRLSSETGNPVEVRLYEDARHELLNEINRQEVFQDIYQWLKKNIKKN